MSPEMALDKPAGLKVTIGQLLASAESGALNKLMAEPLRAAVAFRLKKVAPAIDAELRIFNETRIELCEKYGTKSETADNYSIPDDKQAEFQAEFQQLLATEVELRGKVISVFDLGDTKISVADLTALDWLIVE